MSQKMRTELEIVNVLMLRRHPMMPTHNNRELP